MKWLISELRISLSFVLLTVALARATDASLVAHWTFDETSGTSILDSSGNGHTGTLMNGTARAAGIIGTGALYFDGIDDYVTLGMSDQPVPWTAAVWVKREPVSGPSAGILSRNSVSELKLEQYYYLRKLGLTSAGGSTNSTLNYAAPADTWVHVAFVATSAGTSLYINGNFVDSSTQTFALPLDWIGHSTEPMKGWLDDLYVYNRALSPGEIQGLIPQLPPQALADGYAVQKNTTASISAATGVLANDIEYNSGTMTAVRDTDVSHGTVTLSANGAFTYTPTVGYTGPDSFTYHVVDSLNQNSAPAKVSIQVDTITNGLIAYYALDEGSGSIANDYSGNGKAGTLANGPAWTAGTRGGALNFDGVDDSVLLPDGLIHDYTTSSIALWFKTAVPGIIVWQDTGAGTQAGYVPNFYVGSDGKLRGAYWCGTTNPLATSTVVTDNLWHHAVLTGAVNTQSLYLDGKLIGTLSGTIDHGVAIKNRLGSGVVNGWTASPSNPFFTGTLDDVRFYNRALSLSEVQTLSYQPPVAANDTYGAAAGQQLSVAAPGVLSNDTAFGGTTLSSAVPDTNVSHGTLSLNANGSFVYTAFNGYSGADTFTYHAVDSQNGVSSSATVTINVINLTVTSAVPAIGAPGQQVPNVTISGSGFNTDSVQLKKGAAVINGGNVRVNSSSQMLVDFNLAGASEGVYDVVVVNPATGATATLSAAFTVQYPSFNITAMTPAPASVQTSAVSSILLTCNQALNPLTVNANSVKVTRAGPDGILDTADDVAVTPTSITVVNSNQIQIGLPTQANVTEKYRVTLLSDGTAPPPTTTLPTIGLPVEVQVIDMDGDGIPDLVVGSNSGLPTAVFHKGLGNGQFSSTYTAATDWNQATYCLFVADFNKDGKPDIVQGSNGASSNAPVVLNATTTPGSFSFVANQNFTMGSNDNCVRGFDLNNDGLPDLISSNQASGNVGVRLNTTTPGSNTLSFGAHTTFATGSTCRFVTVGDINGDGKPDIVSCNYGVPSVSVLLNTMGTGATTPTFLNAVNFTTDTQPNSVELADINGDGKLDIIVPCFNVNKVDVFLNTTPTNSTTPTFSQKYTFAVGTGASYVSAFDVDGDGKPDILCANETTNDIALLINTTPAFSSTPTFAQAVKYTVGSRPVAVKGADLTGTGKRGFVCCNYNSNTITVVYPFSASIQNTTGVNLDGEFGGAFPSGAGFQGGNFTTTFEVDLTPTTTVVTAPAPIVYGTSSEALTASVSGGPIQNINVGSVTFQLTNASGNVGSAVTANVTLSQANANYAIPSGTPVGTYTVVATYNGSGAYAGSSDNSQKLSITPAALSATPNPASRAYGAANPAFSGAISGIKYSDNITATYSTTAVPVSAIGPYAIVPALVDPGGRLGNYTVSLNNGTLTVSQAALSVIGAPATRAYGAANPAFTGTITGIENSDNITATYSTSATVLSTVGTYAIVPALVDPGNKLTNYNITSTNGTLTITKAGLSAAALNASRTYGAANPTFSGILSGVLNGDNILAVYGTTATPGSPVGSYSIVPSLLDPDSKLGNYTVNLSNGTLTIGKANLSVVADNLSRTYGAANPTLTGVITGIQNSDNISATYATSATALSVVGNYTIVPTLADPGNKLGNYTVTSTNGMLAVKPAALVVTPLDVSRVYGLPNPALSGDVSGIQNGDNITADFSTTATAASNAGAYPINATLDDPDSKLSNYAVTLNMGTLTVNKSTPAITWPAPAGIVAGNPLDSTQLNASAQDANSAAPLTGTFAYQPDIGALLAPGLQETLSATFTPDDATNYTTATAQQTIDVAPAIPPAITSALNATTAINAAFAYTITADGSAPLAFGASGLPAGLALTGADISGNPTASGVFNVTLTAANYGGSDSKILKLTVIGGGTNHAPAFTSPPTVSANPAVVGDTLSFAAQATDADGDALDYNWDFGDGTAADGASVSKIFAAPGVYVVTVTVSDGQASATQSVDLVVNAQASQDTFAVTKIKLGFSFTKSGNDNLSLSGQIPLPPGFFPAGKVVRILIGGFDTSVTLSDKGTSADKSFSLRSKNGSTTASFSFAAKNRNLFAPLQGLGFSKTASNPALNFPVIVVLDGTSHFANPTLVYTVKVNRLGPQSGSGKH
ncbi:MAG TPA: MBG domain-containing protein [Planctomycetota bacterium]|nr:MBG domain-containing protein [Planctomycetota bacterium]